MPDYVKRHGSASVKQLAEAFFLHEATVRRDLNALARAGQLTRVHGGAAAMEGLQAEIPLYVRETAIREIKWELARKAAALLELRRARDPREAPVTVASHAMLIPQETAGTYRKAGSV